MFAIMCGYSQFVHSLKKDAFGASRPMLTKKKLDLVFQHDGFCISAD